MIKKKKEQSEMNLNNVKKVNRRDMLKVVWTGLGAMALMEMGRV